MDTNTETGKAMAKGEIADLSKNSYVAQWMLVHQRPAVVFLVRGGAVCSTEIMYTVFFVFDSFSHG